MNLKKKILALAILIAFAFLIIYAVQSYSLNKAHVSQEEDSYIFDYGVDVPEITEPKYVSVGEADEIIADGLPGVAIEVNGEQYFYPYQILNWHQIVNASFDGLDLTVTFDPLCYTDRVYVASGLSHAEQVLNSNTLLEDQGGNLWLQGTGEGISEGVLGQSLEIYTYESVLWSTWKEQYPEGKVLSTDTGVIRDYTRHPFGAYDEGELVYFPVQDMDERFGPKWILDGVVDGKESAAFLREVTKGFGVENGTLNGTQYVGFYDFEQGKTNVFIASANNQSLTFTYEFGEEEWRDEQTDSVWNSDGLAISGELEGTQLESVQTYQSFWFCWESQHENTSIGHADNIDVVDDQPEGTDIEINLSQ